jgi:hypothetical protein
MIVQLAYTVFIELIDGDTNLEWREMPCGDGARTEGGCPTAAATAGVDGGFPARVGWREDGGRCPGGRAGAGIGEVPRMRRRRGMRGDALDAAVSQNGGRQLPRWRRRGVTAAPARDRSRTKGG